MADDIPFDKNLDLAPGQVDEPMPGVRRVMADNPGPFTFKGTISYIIGAGRVAIVDPGPDDPRPLDLTNFARYRSNLKLEFEF